MKTYVSEIEIEELTGTLKRKVTLRGPSLPHKGVTFGTNNRVSTTWYSGNATEATQQILGPTEAPTSFDGYWRRTLMGKDPALYSSVNSKETKITTPFVLKDIMESIARDGCRVKVTWTSMSYLGAIFSEQRIGRFENITFKYDTESDIGWTANFAWMSRGTEQQRVVAFRNADPSQSADALVLLMNEITEDFDDDFTARTSGQKRIKGQGVPTLSLNQLSALADYPNNLMKGVTRDLNRVVKQFNDAVEIYQKFQSIPGQLSNTITTAMKNTETLVKQYKQKDSGIPAEERSIDNAPDNAMIMSIRADMFRKKVDQIGKESKNSMYQFLTQFSRSGNNQAQTNSNQSTSANTVDTMYITKDGDTPSSVSMKFFNTYDRAIDILKCNHLPWTMTFFPVGKILIIPSSKSAVLLWLI